MKARERRPVSPFRRDPEGHADRARRDGPPACDFAGLWEAVGLLRPE